MLEEPRPEENDILNVLHLVSELNAQGIGFERREKKTGEGRMTLVRLALLLFRVLLVKAFCSLYS